MLKLLTRIYKCHFITGYNKLKKCLLKIKIVKKMFIEDENRKHFCKGQNS